MYVGCLSSPRPVLKAWRILEEDPGGESVVFSSRGKAEESGFWWQQRREAAEAEVATGLMNLPAHCKGKRAKSRACPADCVLSGCHRYHQSLEYVFPLQIAGSGASLIGVPGSWYFSWLQIQVSWQWRSISLFEKPWVQMGLGCSSVGTVPCWCEPQTWFSGHPKRGVHTWNLHS